MLFLESDGKLKHLEHVEDHVINDGHHGYAKATQHLFDVHNQMSGASGKTRVSTKVDGSPAIVFGHHPETNKFFVASKSAFNKTPKINYTHSDIEKNHGHAPGLVTKLKAALDHLPKVTPKGIFQADIMHTQGDVKVDGDHVNFTPNTLTYHAHVDSDHGKAALKSKIGVAVHTEYKGDDFQGIKSSPINNLKRFGNHKDVHLIDVQHDVQKSTYKPSHQKKFESEMKKAESIHSVTQRQHYAAIKGHEVPLKTYINDTVRKGTTPSVLGYADHFTKQNKKKIDALKTPKAKADKTVNLMRDVNHIYDNKDAFDNVLKIHHHLQSAKNVLTKSLNTGSQFGHSIAGKKSAPEGFVVTDNTGSMSKFVDRATFSRANFEKNRG